MMLSCNATKPELRATEIHEAQKRAEPAKDPRLAEISKALSSMSQISPERALAAIAAEAAILANPGRFLQLLEKIEQEEKAVPGLFLLVDKQHELPQNYEPDDIVSLNDYPVSIARKDLKLRKSIMIPVLKLVEAALNDGVDLVFASSYRSWEYQKGLFERYSMSYGEAEAARFSARAGQSQHQLGTVMDFAPISDDFAATKAGHWMKENAAKYGFSISFPENMENVTGYIWESWHYRYLSIPACSMEKEYFGGIQQYLLEFINILCSSPKLIIRKCKQKA